MDMLNISNFFYLKMFITLSRTENNRTLGINFYMIYVLHTALVMKKSINIFLVGKMKVYVSYFPPSQLKSYLDAFFITLKPNVRFNYAILFNMSYQTYFKLYKITSSFEKKKLQVMEETGAAPNIQCAGNLCMHRNTIYGGFFHPVHSAIFTNKHEKPVLFLFLLLIR